METITERPDMGTHHALLYSTLHSDAYLLMEHEEIPSLAQAIQQAEDWVTRQAGHAAQVVDGDSGQYIAQYASFDGSRIVGSLLYTPQLQDESSENAVTPLLHSPQQNILWEETALLRLCLQPGAEIWFHVEQGQIVLSDHCLYNDARLP